MDYLGRNVTNKDALAISKVLSNTNQKIKDKQKAELIHLKKVLAGLGIYDEEVLS